MCHQQFFFFLFQTVLSALFSIKNTFIWNIVKSVHHAALARLQQKKVMSTPLFLFWKNTSDFWPLLMFFFVAFLDAFFCLPETSEILRDKLNFLKKKLQIFLGLWFLNLTTKKEHKNFLQIIYW
jgi:hypothetical protein